MDCLFCKIGNREIVSKYEFEDDKCFVINDINPKSKVHMLVIPKKHIDSIQDLTAIDQELMGHLIMVARDLGIKLQLGGYRLQYNVGRQGGQEIFHVHMHMMA